MISRYLDEVETRYAEFGIHVFDAVEYTGWLDSEVLIEAHRQLGAKYPVLRGRIVREGDRHRLEVPSDSDVRTDVVRGGLTTLRTEAGGNLDIRKNVHRLVAICGGNRGFVAMQTNHAIIDARAWWHIFRDLWLIYSSIVGGKKLLSTPKSSLPAPPSDLLTDRWDDISFLNERARKEAVSRRSETNYEASDKRIVEWYTRLDRDQTRCFVKEAKAAKTSVHGLLAGLFLTAQRKLIDTDRNEVMSFVSVVDLRERVDPPVGLTDVTNFIVWHESKLQVGPRPNPVEIGMQVKARIDTAMDDKRDIYWPGDVPIIGDADFSLNSAICTNPGVVEKFASASEIDIEDLWLPHPLSVEVDPRAADSLELLPSCPRYAAYSYGERFYLYCGAVADSPLDPIESLIANVKAELHRIVGPSDPTHEFLDIIPVSYRA